MRLAMLALSPSGGVEATFRTEAGEELAVMFTTSSVDGINAATAVPDIFGTGEFAIDAIRRIVSAVVAFEKAADPSAP